MIHLNYFFIDFDGPKRCTDVATILGNWCPDRFEIALADVYN